MLFLSPWRRGRCPLAVASFEALLFDTTLRGFSRSIGAAKIEMGFLSVAIVCLMRISKVHFHDFRTFFWPLDFARPFLRREQRKTQIAI